MFRDKDEELRRLEQELLEEEEADALPEDEEDFDDYDEEDEDPAQDLTPHRGSYRAYNTDTADDDLEDYSEQVLLGRSGRRIRMLCAVAICLILAICAVFGWCVLRYKGVLS